ncbi:hypothetical protein [Cypionkella sp.]|nr:hypothetical protein [Cypionkella sp.]MDO8985334.1 hypothetical protein [Cypionkella sp.]MDP2048453.1 hypothetical protein [Cypionkella sp.]
MVDRSRACLGEASRFQLRHHGSATAGVGVIVVAPGPQPLCRSHK